MPPVPYVLAKEGKKVFCELLQGVKFSYDYVSSVGNCVDIEK